MNTWESGSLKSCTLAGGEIAPNCRCGRELAARNLAEALGVLSFATTKAEGLQADKAGCMQTPDGARPRSTDSRQGATSLQKPPISVLSNMEADLGDGQRCFQGRWLGQGFAVPSGSTMHTLISISSNDMVSRRVSKASLLHPDLHTLQGSIAFRLKSRAKLKRQHSCRVSSLAPSVLIKDSRRDVPASRLSTCLEAEARSFLRAKGLFPDSSDGR